MSPFWNIVSIVVGLLFVVAGVFFYVRGQRSRHGTPETPPMALVGVVPQADHEAALDKLRGELDEQLTALRTKLAEQGAEHQRRWTEREAEWREENLRFQSALRVEYAESKQADARATAKRSRSMLVAMIAEHMAPMLAGFPYNPKDARHWGEVFDFLVYDGLEETGEIRNVVFLEVKTKKSGPRVRNRRERALLDAIKAGRVKYEVWAPKVDAVKEAEMPELETRGADDERSADNPVA